VCACEIVGGGYCAVIVITEHTPPHGQVLGFQRQRQRGVAHRAVGTGLVDALIAVSVTSCSSPSARRAVASVATPSDRASAYSPSSFSACVSILVAFSRSQSPSGRDASEATRARASPSSICPVHCCLHVGQHSHMSSLISCAAFAMHATCPKPEPPRQPQPPCSRRCELPGPLCGSRQTKHVLASASSGAADAADAAISDEYALVAATLVHRGLARYCLSAGAGWLAGWLGGCMGAGPAGSDCCISREDILGYSILYVVYQYHAKLTSCPRRPAPGSRFINDPLYGACMQ
jgi:hypothetical protein